MKVDWDLSLAAHGESLEHVPQRFLISRGVEEKWPHYWVIFPQSTLTFSFLGGTFEDHGALKVEASPMQTADPRDYTLYYCTCHLFSLALGMFAMATARSRLSGGWPMLSSAFPSLAVMKGSLCPWSLTPDEETSQFQLQVLHGPHVPLLLHHSSPVHLNRASLN